MMVITKLFGYLFILILTRVVHVQASILTSNNTMSWQDAVEFCAMEGRTLRQDRHGLDEQQFDRSWTRVYEMERFVTLIGCFESTEVQTSNTTRKECPRKCLNQRPFMFAENLKTECVCVSGSLPKSHTGPCNRSLHILVFGLNETKSSNENCVQLKCDNGTTKLWSVKCEEKADLFCNSTSIPGNFTWRIAAKECKKNYGRLRDFNFKTICKTGLRRTWFGFGSVDSEESYNKNNSKEVMHLKPKQCLSCDSKKCELEDCSTPRLAICEPKTGSVSINMSKETTSVTSLHSKMTTEHTGILTTNHKSRNTSQGRTHIISNNVALQWTTRTNAKESKRTTGNFSTGRLFTTETVISSNANRGHPKAGYARLGFTSMTTERNKILTSNRKSRNRSQERTHVISGKSNNTTQQWTRTDVKVSKRTTNTYSTGGLFSTETVISSNDADQRVDNVLIYVLSSALTISLAIICVCLLYIRSKRKRRKKEDLSRQPVREQLYELADNSQLENMVNDQDRADGGLCAGDPVTSGTGQREDIYNHLRERSGDPSQEGEEGVYSRCVGGDDKNDTYDVTFRYNIQSQTNDSEYNHVVLFDSSAV
uniref:Uncharacterized protein LOC111121933 n=1 Tax=Crassostrea virginica TaxID=6565 RepID=A0A8B8CTV6_CRAVI|nr:uncharacterized protein LOC111121933 [Crassostrea virginica]